MARYQFELDQMRRVPGAVWLHTVRSLYDLWQTHSTESGEACRLIPLGVGTAVAVPGDVVYGLERYISGLRRSYEEGS